MENIFIIRHNKYENQAHTTVPHFNMRWFNHIHGRGKHDELYIAMLPKYLALQNPKKQTLNHMEFMFLAVKFNAMSPIFFKHCSTCDLPKKMFHCLIYFVVRYKKMAGMKYWVHKD